MPRPPLKVKHPPVQEKAVEREVTALFRLCGGEVRSVSGASGARRRPDGSWQSTGTRISKGMSDLEVFFPKHRVFLKWETKTPNGEKLHHRMLRKQPHEVPRSSTAHYKRALAQHEYELLCRTCGIHYGRGGVAEATLLLIHLGIYKEGTT